LTYLGEDKLHNGAKRQPVPAEDCCSACNPHQFLSSLEPVDILRPASAPSANNVCQTLALDSSSKWAVQQANLMRDHWIPQPSSDYMSEELH
jgi:hypothetical protein